MLRLPRWLATVGTMLIIMVGTSPVLAVDSAPPPATPAATELNADINCTPPIAGKTPGQVFAYPKILNQPTGTNGEFKLTEVISGTLTNQGWVNPLVVDGQTIDAGTYLMQGDNTLSLVPGHPAGYGMTYNDTASGSVTITVSARLWVSGVPGGGPDVFTRVDQRLAASFKCTKDPNSQSTVYVNVPGPTVVVTQPAPPAPKVPTAGDKSCRVYTVTVRRHGHVVLRHGKPVKKRVKRCLVLVWTPVKT